MNYENMSKNTVILLSKAKQSKAKQSLNFKLYSKLCLFDYKKLYIIFYSWYFRRNNDWSGGWSWFRNSHTCNR